MKLGREEAIRGILPFIRWNATGRVRITVEAPHVGDPSTMIRVNVNGRPEMWYFTLPDDISFRSVDEDEEENEISAPSPAPTPEEEPHVEEVPDFDVRVWFRGHSMALCNALMNQMNEGRPNGTISWSLLGGPVSPDHYGNIEETVFKNSQTMFPDITGVKVSADGILVSMAHESDDEIPPDDEEEVM